MHLIIYQNGIKHLRMQPPWNYDKYIRLLYYVNNFDIMLLGYSGVYILQFFKKKKHLKSGN